MRYLILLIAIALLDWSGSLALADGAGNSAKGKSTQKRNALGRAKSGKDNFVAFEVTPLHEEAARQFVRQNHPELAALLEPLKTSRLKSYHRAIRDLYRTQQRLKNIRTNDMVRYELELRMWKVRSRVQLLSARLRVKDSPQLREQLLHSLEEQYDIRIAMLQHQRDRMGRSLERIDTQLKKLQADRSQQIQRHFDRMTGAGKTKNRKKNVDAEKGKQP